LGRAIAGGAEPTPAERPRGRIVQQLPLASFNTSTVNNHNVRQHDVSLTRTVRSIFMLNERERFAKWVFLISAVYGILVLAPQYLAETSFGRQLAGAITKPEQFYGFIGVALTWQFVFLAIASDVRRFRPLMLIAVTEKLSFGLAAAALYATARVDTRVLAVGTIDLFLGALFFASFLATTARVQVDTR
jgi:hypothetical protein